MNVGIFMVYLHLLFAFIWVGILISLPLLVIPVLKREEKYREYIDKIGYRMRYSGWVALAGLLTTGLWNMFYRGLYKNPTLHLKLTLFAFLVIVTFIHDLYGPKEKKLKLNQILGKVILLITLIIVFLAVVMLRGSIL